MITGPEAFETQNRAPGHRAVSYTRGEIDCPACDYVGSFKHTGEVTPGNTRVSECPKCGERR